MPGWFTRAIRPPPDDITPNANDPASVPPSTVGPDQLVTPGDPHGVSFDDSTVPGWSPPRIIPSAWSGWPADWWPPSWGGGWSKPADTAWVCLDYNANALSTMPPYLVDAAPTLNSDWMRNPNPDTYASWEDFAKQAFWDYQLGEVFILADARYATGWPARFHVVPPWLVEVELAAGVRRYKVGSMDVTADMLHVRYQSTVADARGHGPLEAVCGRVAAAQVLGRYATTVAQAGLIPNSILEAPETMSGEQAALLRDQWVQQRAQNPGYPAVLSGGLKWTPTQMDPEKMALVDLERYNESRIAVALGVPPFLVGLPGGGDSMTYSNVSQTFDFHWRMGLRPKAQTVMSALSEWLLPRGTRVELNRDEYVQPGPLERAQTAQILNSIVDPTTGQSALSVQEIREVERLDNSTPVDLAAGVLK